MSLLSFIKDAGEKLFKKHEEAPAPSTQAAAPQQESVESLNAGVAAGIALYELSRHRVVGLD